MSNEQQNTFGDIVGMESVVPVKAHRDDIVECSDGTLIPRHEALYDCRDNPHSNEDDRFESNVTIVTEILMAQDEWVCDYCTGNTDYADGYICIVDEDSHNWPNCIEEWLCKEYGDVYGRTNFDDRMQDIVDAIRNELEGAFDCEPQYNSNEYAAYSGNGLCLGGFEMGEYENQIEIDYIPELKELHDSNELDDVLDCVNCDVYISRSKCRVKNEETGYYESVGRETYNPYGRDHADILAYHNPGGRWDFVVPYDRIKELAESAIND